jgi:hypothetical protein
LRGDREIHRPLEQQSAEPPDCGSLELVVFVLCVEDDERKGVLERQRLHLERRGFGEEQAAFFGRRRARWITRWKPA